MGMFDSFNLEKDFPCPKCKKAILGDASSFQTKDLDKCLDTYSFPDYIPSLKKGLVRFYTSCDNCQYWINARGYVKNHLLYKIEILKGKKVFRKIQIKDEDIVKIIKIKQNNREKYYALTSAIKAILVMYYRGEEISPENMKKLEKKIGTDVLKQHSNLLTNNKAFGIDFTILEYLNILNPKKEED